MWGVISITRVALVLIVTSMATLLIHLVFRMPQDVQSGYYAPFLSTMALIGFLAFSMHRLQLSRMTAHLTLPRCLLLAVGLFGVQQVWIALFRLGFNPLIEMGAFESLGYTRFFFVLWESGCGFLFGVLLVEFVSHHLHGRVTTRTRQIAALCVVYLGLSYASQFEWLVVNYLTPFDMSRHPAYLVAPVAGIIGVALVATDLVRYGRLRLRVGALSLLVLILSDVVRETMAWFTVPISRFAELLTTEPAWYAVIILIQMFVPLVTASVLVYTVIRLYRRQRVAPQDFKGFGVAIVVYAVGQLIATMLFMPTYVEWYMTGVTVPYLSSASFLPGGLRELAYLIPLLLIGVAFLRNPNDAYRQLSPYLKGFER
jgi:hypothetical protein